MGYFNTSHVTVYHSRASFCNSFNIHFNTSHVTVYQQRNCTGSTRDIISIHLMLLFITVWMYHPCSRCSISIHLMLLFICNQNCDSRCGWLFQYISCYCLSKIQGASIKYCYGFQYISCYCLSYPVHCLHHSLPHFNTSHVTVYLLHPPNNPYPLSISIHLMLLFISSTNITVGKLIIFQYISCYCLSKC